MHGGELLVAFHQLIPSLLGAVGIIDPLSPHSVISFPGPHSDDKTILLPDLLRLNQPHLNLGLIPSFGSIPSASCCHASFVLTGTSLVFLSSHSPVRYSLLPSWDLDLLVSASHSAAVGNEVHAPRCGPWSVVGGRHRLCPFRQSATFKSHARLETSYLPYSLSLAARASRSVYPRYGTTAPHQRLR